MKRLRRVAGTLAVLALSLGLGACAATSRRPPSALIPPSAADSMTVKPSVARATFADSVRADSLQRAQEEAEARADSARVAADTTRREVPTRSQAKPTRTAVAPIPPLRISAANVTGSRAETGDIVMLNGDVRITRGRLVITADRGRYDRGQGMLYLDDRVRMVDSTTRLTTDHAQYSESDDVLQVNGRVTITDKDAVLKAPLATYDRRTGRAELFGGVEANDKHQKIAAERMIYLRPEQRVLARGSVVGRDQENDMILRADSVDYDRTRHLAYARGNPSLEAVDDKGKSGTLRALTLWLDTDTRVARAVDSVHVIRDTLEARADSARFDDLAGYGRLYGHPRAWDPETKVNGDTVDVYTEKRELRRFVVLGNAVLDYAGAQANTIGETSRLTGDRVDMFVTRNAIDSLRATSNAKNHYTAVPRPGKTAETNDAQGDTITVYFKERKIDTARVLGNASGEYHFAVDVGDTAKARTELVKYDAPSITFHVPQNRIVLEPKAHLTYREMELRAGRVEFDSDQQTLIANDHPELVDKGDRVTGNIMTYDLESRTGNIYQAETTYERGLYHGGQIRKSGENELDVKSGRYSTCDLPEPHYHFQAKYMKILLRDKMVAKPVVFYIKNVPLLALPFWVFPIKPGRHSGLLLPQVEFGFNNRQGQFIRNFGYYWAVNDYVDFTASGDFYQADPSWVARFESVYKLLYKMDGIVQGSYRRSDNPLNGGDEWSFNADHSQELSPRTSVKARGEFVSSREYHRDATYGPSLANRLDRFLVSNVSLTHNADWASFNAVVDRRQDLDADQQLLYTTSPGNTSPPAVGTEASLASLTESTPNLSVSFPTRSVGGLPRIRNTGFGRAFTSLYVTLNASLASYHEKRGVITGYLPTDTTFFDTTGVIARIDSSSVVGHVEDSRRAFSGSTSLRDSRRLFGWLNVAPFFNGNLVVFDKDNLGNTVVPTGTWSSGLSSGTTFYGTFRTHLGSLVGVRHVVAPSISYNYAPEFPNLFYTDSLGHQQARFTSFPGGSVSGGFKQSNMSFSLSQRFQAKLQHGDRVERLDNLLAWDMSGSYNFLYQQQGLAHPLSPIGSSMRLQPPGVFTADLSWVMDVYQPNIVRTLGYNMNLFLSGGRSRLSSTPTTTSVSNASSANGTFDVPWSVALAYSYQGGYSGSLWSANKIVNGIGNVSLTPNWRVQYVASYDLNKSLLLTQNFSLTRDLHCWQASFTRSFVVDGETSYYFRIGIKEQREIYLERGTRVQSFGGIQ